MIALRLGQPTRPLEILCLGAHADDIEIGCGGTILSLIERNPDVRMHWCVFSGSDERRREAEASAETFCNGAAGLTVEVAAFDDGYFPYNGIAIKGRFEELKQRVEPDVILTHSLDDAHQDHREIGQLTWNTFRHHFIIEYEIPKYDGDLGRPNAYVPLGEALLERKIALLQENFPTQRQRQWFDPVTFRGIARIRGLECAAPERYAEAFHVRKCVLA